jgi:hypothetical protein
MATYTADAAQNNFVREVHVGPTVVVSRYIAGGVTISTGDVYRMVNVPNGATITDVRYYGRAAGVGGIIFDLGYVGSALTTLSVFGKATISATDQIQSGALASLPWTVSVSDDATPYITLTLQPSAGTATATGTFGLVVTYTRAGAGRPGSGS